MSACVNTLIIISKTLIYALYLIEFNYKYDAKVDRMGSCFGTCNALVRSGCKREHHHHQLEKTLIIMTVFL